jgi:hypothetical protein
MRFVNGAITLVANSWQGSAEVTAPTGWQRGPSYLVVRHRPCWASLQPG